MRILIISDAWSPQVNGVVRTYEDLIPHLEAANHIVKVIGPADFKRRRPLPGYPEIELVLLPGGALKKLVDDFRPDTIHIATEGPLGWSARRLCLRRGWPFTTAYHTHFPDYVALRAAKKWPALHDPVKKCAIRLIRRFHAPSHGVLTTTASVEKTLRKYGFETPLFRLTRGVDTELFHPGPRTLFTDMKRPVALYVGRVAIEKNIAAFLSMKWAGSKVVVGHGPDLGDLKKRYPDIVFTGIRKGHELAEHFRSADIFVFPSRTDTFGLVLIEAMACGLPLAGYPVSGPGDIVTQPLLGSVNKNLAIAAQEAFAAPGSGDDRFAYLQETYNWNLAREQFEAAIETACIAYN
ncbi:MAG: glycosyl transferase group 1 family protein [Micavibrio sp.]|nr:glycosyl transferase group 1 family protein [Micavibrio sp.]